MVLLLLIALPVRPAAVLLLWLAVAVGVLQAEQLQINDAPTAAAAGCTTQYALTGTRVFCNQPGLLWQECECPASNLANGWSQYSYKLSYVTTVWLYVLFLSKRRA